MPMYNVIQYSDNYSKTFGTLWLYCWNKPALDNNCHIADFADDIATD